MQSLWSCRPYSILITWQVIAFCSSTVWLCAPVDHCLSGRKMACHACACVAVVLAGHLCIAFSQYSFKGSVVMK